MEPRARFELAFPEYRSGASPTMLTGLEILEPMERIERSSVAYHATALPLSYIGWSQRGYSKPRPPRYECGALPLELLRHGASAENRTPLSGLAIRCPANRPHPRKQILRYLFSCQRPPPRHTCSALPSAEGKLDNPLIPRQNEKRGGHFWWPPLFLKIG